MGINFLLHYLYLGSDNMANSKNIEQNEHYKNSNPGEHLVIILIFIITGGFLYESIGLTGIIQGQHSGIGSLPQIITIIVIILNGFLLLQYLKGKKKNMNFKNIIYHVFPKEVIILIMLVISYALLIEKLHFRITTLLFLWIGMVSLDKKRPILKLIIALGVLASLLLIFSTIFKVLLP